jgi:ADP-ribose pyrophosphatase
LSGREGERGERLLGQGRFLRLVERKGWELVERPGIEAIAVLVAVTAEGELLLVEQHREPVGGLVLELPAGLVGDGDSEESLEEGARRELLEETGYQADELEVLAHGPPSAGLSSEVVTMLWAPGVRKVADGGGVGGEGIRVHPIPLEKAPAWLAARQAQGQLVDPKVWAALWFASKMSPWGP